MAIATNKVFDPLIAVRFLAAELVAGEHKCLKCLALHQGVQFTHAFILRLSFTSVACDVDHECDITDIL